MTAKRPSVDEPYSKDRVDRWVAGELTLAELDGFSDADLKQIAVTGHRLVETGQLGDAAIIFKGLVALSPKVSYFHTALGAIALAAGNLDDATARLDEALALDETNAEALVHRGEVRLLRGLVKEATADLTVAIALDAGKERACTQRARGLLSSVRTG
jgi:Flp pilus assembly protein TadD